MTNATGVGTLGVGTLVAFETIKKMAVWSETGPSDAKQALPVSSLGTR